MMLLRELTHLPIVTCAPEATISGVARSMERERVGSVVVVDAHGDVVGIITDRDLALEGLGHELDPETPVEAIMSRGVVTISDTADVFDAAEAMAKARCRRLPVVDERGYPVGIVTFDDLMLLLTRQADDLAHTVATESVRPIQV